MYRSVVPVYTRFLDPSISAFQSISRNSEGHVESAQPIKCMIFIVICNKYFYNLSNDLNRSEKPFEFGDKLYSQFLFINFKTINNILMLKFKS